MGETLGVVAASGGVGSVVAGYVVTAVSLLAYAAHLAFRARRARRRVAELATRARGGAGEPRLG